MNVGKGKENKKLKFSTGCDKIKMFDSAAILSETILQIWNKLRHHLTRWSKKLQFRSSRS